MRTAAAPGKKCGLKAASTWVRAQAHMKKPQSAEDAMEAKRQSVWDAWETVKCEVEKSEADTQHKTEQRQQRGTAA